MTAAPHSPLVEKVAEAVASIIDDAISNGAIRFMGRERTPYLPTDTANELAGQIIEACHAEELREALQAAHAHVQELRDAWERGAISEHDGLGGTRSNRNVDVEVQLRDLLAKLDGRSPPAPGLGYCPTCGAPGRSREKRPFGDDLCEAGHRYPSSNALPAKLDGAA